MSDVFSGNARIESGNGGYGYNNAYVGVQTALNAKEVTIITTDLAGAAMHQIKRPADTLMFADCEFVNPSLIEYSFAEPRFTQNMDRGPIPRSTFATLARPMSPGAIRTFRPRDEHLLPGAGSMRATRSEKTWAGLVSQTTTPTSTWSRMGFYKSA